MKPIIHLVILLAAVDVTGFAIARADDATGVYDVSKRGVAGDGTTLVTSKVQALVTECHAAGGGRIHFPPGRYRIASLELKDNVFLDLAPGAILLGSADIKDYLKPYLIYARGARNFGIIGQGTIDGNGESFWKNKREPLIRPERLILFEDCQTIRVNGIKLLNSPNWNLELLRCRFVWIDGVTIISPRNSPNTDGIDPNSSSDVFISNCHIDTGDDAICLKSVGTTPTENVVVQNCVLISDDTAIKLGTRSEAPIRNLSFNNIVIRNTRYGIGFYAKDGGVFENVRFSNISIQTATDENQRADRPSGSYAIFMDIERRTPDGPVSRIRDVYFNDLNIESVDARCLFLGMPEQPIENLHFNNMNYTQLRHRTFEGSRKPRGVKNLKDRAVNDYAYIPAIFSFAHVNNLDVDGLAIHDRDKSGRYERHMIWGKDVAGASLNRLRTRMDTPNTKLSQILFDDARDLRITSSRPSSARVPFLTLTGGATTNVALLYNDFSEVATVLKPPPEVPAAAVRLEGNLNRQPPKRGPLDRP